MSTCQIDIFELIWWYLASQDISKHSVHKCMHDFLFAICTPLYYIYATNNLHIFFGKEQTIDFSTISHMSVSTYWGKI